MQIVDSRIAVSDCWWSRSRSFNRISRRERRVGELTADIFRCWVDDRLGIHPQPHAIRDMIRHAFTPLSTGDAQNLMRELHPNAGLNRKAHAARRPEIIIEVSDGSFSEVRVVPPTLITDAAFWLTRLNTGSSEAG